MTVVVVVTLAASWFTARPQLQYLRLTPFPIRSTAIITTLWSPLLPRRGVHHAPLGTRRSSRPRYNAALTASTNTSTWRRRQPGNKPKQTRPLGMHRIPPPPASTSPHGLASAPTHLSGTRLHLVLCPAAAVAAAADDLLASP